MVWGFISPHSKVGKGLLRDAHPKDVPEGSMIALPQKEIMLNVGESFNFKGKSGKGVFFFFLDTKERSHFTTDPVSIWYLFEMSGNPQGYSRE